MKILGLSCYNEEASACVIDGGVIEAAAIENRFTRRRGEHGFPLNAMRYCITKANVDKSRLGAVAFSEKPLLKFHRILETHLTTAPQALRPFINDMTSWTQQKLWMEPTLHDELDRIGVNRDCPIYFFEHQESHAASAFFPSPYTDAAILTLDTVGEWSTSSIGAGIDNNLRILQELEFPHSLGLLYSTFTTFVGFNANSEEYRLMELAPYGESTYSNLILSELLDLKPDGSFRLNMDYFSYFYDLAKAAEKLAGLFGISPRLPGSPITQYEMNIAASIQDIAEEILVKMSLHARGITNQNRLCLAGNVVMNSLAMGKLIRKNIFQDVWIQPASGDAGASIGAALLAWHKVLGNSRSIDGEYYGNKGCYLGPEYRDDAIADFLDNSQVSYIHLDDSKWAPHVASLIGEENVVGLFFGRMEFGALSLGHRSIVGDARSQKIQSAINVRIKNQSELSVLTAACLENKIDKFFQLETPSRNELLYVPFRSEYCPKRNRREKGSLAECVAKKQRSFFPAITDGNFSAYVHPVNPTRDARFYDLLFHFEKLTGCGLIISTDFSIRGGPAVCTPSDAYRYFMRTDMDYLVLGSFLLDKQNLGSPTIRSEWSFDARYG
jgi:carbamoyltransferase